MRNQNEVASLTHRFPILHFQDMFELVSEYPPAGDQPQAIAKLTEGILAGAKHQVLLGVTGSGKTFTIANVIKTDPLQEVFKIAPGEVGIDNLQNFIHRESLWETQFLRQDPPINMSESISRVHSKNFDLASARMKGP